MKIGVQIPNFTWPGGAEKLGPTLANIVKTADQGGFEYIAVMDHFWQLGGQPQLDMLEAYTALGFIAAHTERAKLLTVVTGALYRYPGILAKIISTLDVLSNGRAILGVGAGWNEEESRGLGIPFPPVKERFELLEEALQICLQMWSESEEPYQGKHSQLGRTLNVPQPLAKPHPPIMIGGGGEKKTLRFVAKYAQLCNVFDSPDIERKLTVLREHCQAEGRDYDEIEKTAYYVFNVGENGERVGETITRLRELADLGVQTALGKVEDVHLIKPLEIIANEVIPAVAEF
ncbi:MAG TPA: LLM class F420-dependent oxidoreductase [Pseudonocardiaceae bacterium]|nr:LLM class F420-dependent oxidoreductase [Pseudonocardiaceae bacterium]